MFKNIKYEFKKVISKNFIFLLLLLLIINGINIFVNYNQRKDKIYDQGYSVIYNKIKGTISNEKIEFISNGLSSTSKKVNNGNYNKKKIIQHILVIFMEICQFIKKYTMSYIMLLHIQKHLTVNLIY